MKLKLPAFAVSHSICLCEMVLCGLTTSASAQNPAPLPKAVVVQQIPGNLKNGVRPWPELPESEVAKIRAALPDKAQVAPARPRKLLVFYRTDGFPHASIPHWNKCIELLGQKTGAFTVTLTQSYDDLTPEKLKDFDALFFNNTCRMKTPEPVKAACAPEH